MTQVLDAQLEVQREAVEAQGKGVRLDDIAERTSQGRRRAGQTRWRGGERDDLLRYLGGGVYRYARYRVTEGLSARAGADLARMRLGRTSTGLAVPWPRLLDRHQPHVMSVSHVNADKSTGRMPR